MNDTKREEGYAFVKNFRLRTKEELVGLLDTMRNELFAIKEKEPDWIHYQRVAYVLRHNEDMRDFKRCYPVTFSKFSVETMKKQDIRKMKKTINLASEDELNDETKFKILNKIHVQPTKPVKRNN